MLHYSVLLNESIDLLSINPDGTYIDGTFGRGGHTTQILSRLSDKGRLIAIDKDLSAIDYANQNIQDDRFTIVHSSFAEINNILVDLNIDKVDGILLDLGVSSPQLDEASRGFSFRYDAPLDMRMDTTSGMTASEWLNVVSEQDLANVIYRYGEERASYKIAKEIIANCPINSTAQLAELVSKVVPRKHNQKIHPATKTFQAIRIFINEELSDLEKFLQQAPSKLVKDGRLVIISFHSLEDRIVKQSFNNYATPEHLPKWVMANANPSKYKVIAKKVRADIFETQENTRSRSAILRALERSYD